MKPLFTVDGGEYLVGLHVEKTFKNVNLWVPAKDTGIDLLITDQHNNSAVSLQVKSSVDYAVRYGGCEGERRGWFTLNRDKIAKSSADFWVFAIIGKNADFVIIKPKELLSRLESLRKDAKALHCYLSITKSNQCYETRGLSKDEMLAISKTAPASKTRNFTQFLDNWGPIGELNKL